jgi:F420-non-reducing hydrogenase iron-sulfur subunit
MVHPELVLESLSQGADGVLVLGCQLGECHYIDGNRKAQARFEMIHELLEDFGFEEERFSLAWVSSAEPEKFVQAVTEMMERIRHLGEAAEQTTKHLEA